MSHALPNIGKVATKALQTIDVTQLEPSYLKASGFREIKKFWGYVPFLYHWVDEEQHIE